MAGSKMRCGLTFLVLIIGVYTQLATAKRILLLPYPTASHIRQLTNIGDQLVDIGHEVYVVFNPNCPDIHRFQDGKVGFNTHRKCGKGSIVFWEYSCCNYSLLANYCIIVA